MGLHQHSPAQNIHWPLLTSHRTDLQRAVAAEVHPHETVQDETQMSYFSARLDYLTKLSLSNLVNTDETHEIPVGEPQFNDALSNPH